MGSFWMTGGAAGLPPNSEPVVKLGKLAPQPAKPAVAKATKNSLAICIPVGPTPETHNSMAQANRRVNG